MQTASVMQIQALGFPWETIDPFLFCVFHDDAYPRGNGHFGPAAPLAGRNLGQDFAGKDGWRMYHGLTVPGFPSHPHRGFETGTLVRKGFIDHSDSLGAGARFGAGDVQWLTAGRGIVHAEMFPLLDGAAPNPLQLFQIWLNLPARSKMAEPHFTMFWAEQIPRRVFTDGDGGTTAVVCIAGRPAEADNSPHPLPPPPDSWAAQADADLAIWTIRMAPGARWTLPAAAGGEPVAQYGPFVMNTEQELKQAYADYHRTAFGGWPWPDSAPVHGEQRKRFARHADGRMETPLGQGMD